MWPDISLVCRTSAFRRYSRLVATLRKATGAPVIQTWVGWSGPYEGKNELDGIASTLGQGQDALRPTVMAASSLARRSFSTWGVQTVTDSREATGLYYRQLLEQSGRLGFRGLFVRTSDADLKPLADKLQGLAWPEASTAPFTYFPLYSDSVVSPGERNGVWMLPVPLAGRRIDALGPIDGYSYQNAGSRIAVMWSREGTVDARMRTGEAETAVVNSQGQSISTGSRSVSFRLTADPTTVTFKGPEPAEQSSIEAYANLVRFLNERMGAVANPTGTSDVVLRRASELASRAPAKALAMVRAEAEDVCSRVFPIAWFDVSRPTQESEGVLARILGSREDSAWSLDQAFPLSEGVSAEWKSSKKFVRPATLWIAARVPEGQGEKVSVELNGVKAGTLSEPVHPYGPGFAWFKLGDFPFNRPFQSVVIRNQSSVRGVAVDAILLTPFPFEPDGGRYPFAMVEKLIRSGKLGE
jgi:hypothetical protein